MKLKHFIILFFLSVTTFSYAQNSSSNSISDNNNSVKPILRLEAGYAGNVRYADLIGKSPLYTERVGISLEYPLQYNFGITAGLNYNFGYGKKSQYYVAPKDTITYKYFNHSLNIPVRLNYTLPIFWNMKVFGYAGPNFIIGIAEPMTVTNAKFDNQLTDTYWDIKSENYDNYSRETKRFDIQLGAGGGIQWRQYRVKSGYDWGILNASKIGGYQHNNGWYVSFEYEL